MDKNLKPNSPNIARIAALIGDRARANMLVALMRGGARTVSELAAEAGVGLATASSHVAQLQAGGLITARKSGRHKYLELTSGDVASVIEQLMALSGGLAQPRIRPGPKDGALRDARVCYDHLAGAKGVQLFQSLTNRGYLAHTTDGLALTHCGTDFVLALGLPACDLRPGKPPLCRECLDWSMRESHLAGRLGRVLLAEMEKQGWMTRNHGSRGLIFSAKGSVAFDQAFPPVSAGVLLDAAPDSP